MRRTLPLVGALGWMLASLGVPLLGRPAGAETQTTTVFVPATAGGTIMGTGSVAPVDTGFDLTAGVPVTISASGTASFCGPAYPQCFTDPDGAPADLVVPHPLLPGYPDGELVAKVGDGPWVAVGSGPTEVSGSGRLLLAYNDDIYRDNSGGYTVTLSVTCQPGYGHGDKNHLHCGPPGQQ